MSNDYYNSELSIYKNYINDYGRKIINFDFK